MKIFNGIPAGDAYETIKAAFIVIERKAQEQRLTLSPWSLVELQPDNDDFAWLCDWARQLNSGVTDRCLREQLWRTFEGKDFSYAVGIGTLLLMSAVEVARREENERSLWATIEKSNFPETTKQVLFTQGYPTRTHKDAIALAARRLKLRHVFDIEDVQLQRWFDTIYLQFGFAKHGFMRRLPEWLVGPVQTQAIQRLLSGPMGSATFQALWEALRNFRREYIKEEEVRSLLRNNPWVLPEWTDDLVRQACAERHLGYERDSQNVSVEAVYESPWRLSLVSPPALQYTTNGVPMLEMGHEVLIEVSSPAGVMRGAEFVELRVECNDSSIAQTEQPIGEHSYFSFSLHETGEYCVRGRGGQAKPLKFIVTEASSQQTAYPVPLKVHINSEHHSLSLSAFNEVADQDGKHEIDLAVFGKEVVPSIQIQCPVQVDVIWVCDHKRGERRRADAANVQDYLADLLPLALTSEGRFVLSIDAGAFGSLDLHLIPPHRAQMEQSVTSLPSVVVRRMRWLVTTVLPLARQGRQVPLPYGVRKMLAVLSERPDGASLAKLTHVPQMLLPHMCALAYMIEQCSNFQLH